MTTKTVVYRYMKSRGFSVKESYAIAEELSNLIDKNTSK